MKIAFLFLVVNGIFHEPCWVEYFKNHHDRCTIYVHSKKGVPTTSFFKQFELDKRIATTWHNTMKAQIELLRVALQDPANEKFIFLSESTIPLQSFESGYSYLLSHPFSEFRVFPNRHTERHYHSIKKENVYKNSQWIILNRKHAEMMVADSTMINMITSYPFDNEHYPSTFLASHHVLEEIVQHDCTFVLWPEDSADSAHPHMFNDLSSDPYTDFLVQEILTRNSLFARKFSNTCDVTSLIEYAKRCGM